MGKKGKGTIRVAPSREEIEEKLAEGVKKRNLRGKKKKEFLAQLEEGTEMEQKEHTDDPEVAEEIAKQHLAEFDDYYIRLKQMEAKAEAEQATFDP